MNIDLNCDLGEGCPHDAELMPLITSANIACGFHAGDPSTMWTALNWPRPMAWWPALTRRSPTRIVWAARDGAERAAGVRGLYLPDPAPWAPSPPPPGPSLLTSSRTARSTTWPAAMTTMPSCGDGRRACSTRELSACRGHGFRRRASVSSPRVSPTGVICPTARWCRAPGRMPSSRTSRRPCARPSGWSASVASRRCAFT